MTQILLNPTPLRLPARTPRSAAGRSAAAAQGDLQPTPFPLARVVLQASAALVGIVLLVALVRDGSLGLAAVFGHVGNPAGAVRF